MLDIAAGHWRGTVKTWLDPNAEPASNDMTATTSAVLGGKSVQIDYRSHVGESRSDGLMILGKDIRTGRLSLTWIDTFHTGSNVMNFAADESGVLRGEYAAGDEMWRWRLVIHATAGELRIQHFNISPAGEEDRAIEAVLTPGARE
ncbi:MAG TPA: DUF1579 family protein [Thermoanaerobaculia bacterium]